MGDTSNPKDSATPPCEYLNLVGQGNLGGVDDERRTPADLAVAGLGSELHPAALRSRDAASSGNGTSGDAGDSVRVDVISCGESEDAVDQHPNADAEGRSIRRRLEFAISQSDVLVANRFNANLGQRRPSPVGCLKGNGGEVSGEILVEGGEGHGHEPHATSLAQISRGSLPHLAGRFASCAITLAR